MTAAASGSADIASSVVIGSGAGKQCFVDSTFATRNVMIGVEAGLSASGDNGDFGYNNVSLVLLLANLLGIIKKWYLLMVVLMLKNLTTQ